VSSDVLAEGRYRVIRRLAAGGMGEVLLAQSPGDRVHGLSPGILVVKRTLPDSMNRPHQDAMLKEEGRLALRLLHDNLVESFLVDDDHGTPLLIMEYLAGRSVAQVLGQAKKRGELVPVEVVLAVIRAAACGLHFAHTLSDKGKPLGLVHRDVSPANIFMTFDGRVKVIDFGVAKSEDSEIKTSTGLIKGKLGYMSPEHALGNILSPAADVWSLGVVFWESLVAERLFSGNNPSITLFQITDGPIQPPNVLRPDVPREVNALVLRMLERDVKKRFANCRELVAAIDALPQARNLASVNLGTFLSGRFPDQAEQGQLEVQQSAHRTRNLVVPKGLVDGTAVREVEVVDDGATIRMGGAELQQVMAQMGMLGSSPNLRAPTPMHDIVDDGRTEPIDVAQFMPGASSPSATERNAPSSGGTLPQPASPPVSLTGGSPLWSTSDEAPTRAVADPLRGLDLGAGGDLSGRTMPMPQPSPQFVSMNARSAPPMPMPTPMANPTPMAMPTPMSSSYGNTNPGAPYGNTNPGAPYGSTPSSMPPTLPFGVPSSQPPTMPFGVPPTPSAPYASPTPFAASQPLVSSSSDALPPPARPMVNLTPGRAGPPAAAAAPEWSPKSGLPLPDATIDFKAPRFDAPRAAPSTSDALRLEGQKPDGPKPSWEPKRANREAPKNEPQRTEQVRPVAGQKGARGGGEGFVPLKANEQVSPSKMPLVVTGAAGVLLVLGLILSVTHEARMPRAVWAYTDPAGFDVVVALPEHVPAGAPSRAIDLAGAELLKAGDVQPHFVDGATLKSRLDGAAILERATLPTTGGGKLGALMPLLLVVLALMVAGVALPMALVDKKSRTLVTAGVVALALVIFVGGLSKGALGWPGLSAYKDVPKLEWK
jgi:serine/threonine-protein kinase